MRIGTVMLITRVNQAFIHFSLNYPKWTHRFIPDLVHQILPNPNFLNAVRSHTWSSSIMISMLQKFKTLGFKMTLLMKTNNKLEDKKEFSLLH